MQHRPIVKKCLRFCVANYRVELDRLVFYIVNLLVRAETIVFRRAYVLLEFIIVF